MTKDEIRKQISTLVSQYAELCNIERLESLEEETGEPLYVVGWVVSAEWESTSLMEDSYTATLNIYPEDQPRSMSRGLYELGADNYRA